MRGRTHCAVISRNLEKRLEDGVVVEKQYEEGVLAGEEYKWNRYTTSRHPKRVVALCENKKGIVMGKLQAEFQHERK